MSLNACELQIDLFCNGMRVPSDVSLEGARSGPGSVAGLGSGLEIVIPTGSRFKPAIWLNVPITERFARSSPYVLQGAAGKYAVKDDRTAQVYPIRVPTAPSWYHRLTSRDVPMSSVGVLQGTALHVSIDPTCAFWDSGERCLFCATGQSLARAGEARRTIEDVVETCWAAKEYSGVTYVQLNGGCHGERGLRFAEPFVRAIKQDVGLLVGVQLTPEHDCSAYARLIDAGVDSFSFCAELLDASWFTRICPGKARTIGQPLFFKAMDYCASRLPRGAVAGEVIAGLEPIANTIEAIERIVAAGAYPIVVIFRPLAGSLLESSPPPRFEEMVEVMRAMYDACRRARLPIGVAPNLEVSLSVSPEDAAMLAPRTAAFYRYELWRFAARVAARPVFGARLRARPRRIPVESGANSGPAARR
jgi:hypothetical protein